MMDFTWFIVGLLTSVSAAVVYEVYRRIRLGWIDWCFLLVGFGLILFAIPWAVASVLEGVPRAASMGLLLFGLPGIAVLTFGGKRLGPRLAESDYSPETSKAQKDSPVGESQKARPQWKEIKIKPLPWPKPVAYAAYGVLAAALLFGGAFSEKDYAQRLKDDFPDAEITVISDSPPALELKYSDGTIKYAAMGKGQGYGGPMILGVLVDSEGTVEKIKLLANQETPAYRQQIADADFPSQFPGKNVADNFIVGDDIDAVTGATVSCVAGAQAIRSAAHLIAVNTLEMEPTWKDEHFQFGIEELSILLIIILTFIPMVQKNKWLRYSYYAVGLAITGFWTNACLSVGSLAGLSMGYAPAIKSNLVWWMLVGTTVGAIVVLGKNMWCNKLCPFFGVQYFLNKVGGSGVKLPNWAIKYSRKGLSSLLWSSLLVIFLTRNPALGAYEPFSMMFSLTGVGIQWFLLPASIVGAFFIPLFWCRCFCPLGQCLNQFVATRKKAVKLVFSAKENSHGE